MIDTLLKQIQGWVKIKGSSDGTNIGNTGDRLKTTSTIDGMCNICANNSTDIPLASGATFTGTAGISSLPQVGVMLKTDKNGTLYFDFSGDDGVTWDSTYPVSGFRVKANIHEFHTAVKLGRAFRLRFVNDNDGAQTFLRIRTYFGMNFTHAVTPLNQSISRDSDASIVRSPITQDEINLGLYSGVRSYNEFGFNNDIDASDGDATIWAYTTASFIPQTTASTYTISYNSSTDGSGKTGARSIFFSYLDSNGLYKEEVHTLGSSGSDTTSFSGIGINRLIVTSTGSSNVNNNDITITATGGTVQGFIPAGLSVSQQCIYHVASNARVVAKFLHINALRLGGSSGSPRITIKGIAFDRTTETQYEVYRVQMDTGAENNIQIVDPIGFSMPANHILWFTANTNTNNTQVIMRFSLNEYEDN